METILEQQRRYHEERERLVKLMVDEYATKKASVSVGYVFVPYHNSLNLKFKLDDFFCT